MTRIGEQKIRLHVILMAICFLQAISKSCSPVAGGIILTDLDNLKPKTTNLAVSL